jgi:hypothetical protein
VCSSIRVFVKLILLPPLSVAARRGQLARIGWGPPTAAGAGAVLECLSGLAMKGDAPRVGPRWVQYHAKTPAARGARLAGRRPCLRCALRCGVASLHPPMIRHPNRLLDQMSLDTKRAEIRKLEERARQVHALSGQ